MGGIPYPTSGYRPGAPSGLQGGALSDAELLRGAIGKTEMAQHRAEFPRLGQPVGTRGSPVPAIPYRERLPLGAGFQKPPKVPSWVRRGLRPNPAVLAAQLAIELWYEKNEPPRLEPLSGNFPGFEKICECGPVTAYNNRHNYLTEDCSGCGFSGVWAASDPWLADAPYISGLRRTTGVIEGTPDWFYGDQNELWRRLPGYTDPAVHRPVWDPENNPDHGVAPWSEPVAAWKRLIDPMETPIGKPYGTAPWPYWLIPLRPGELPWLTEQEQTQRGPAPTRELAPGRIVLPSWLPQPRPVVLDQPTLVIDSPAADPLADPSGAWVPPDRGLSHPPGFGQADVKPPKMRGMWKLLNKFNTTTELKDIVEAAYYALPYDCRKKRWRRYGRGGKQIGQTKASKKNLEGTPKPSVPKMMGSLMDCWDEIDMEKFKSNMLYNELQDRVFGTMGKALAKRARADKRLVGYQAGGMNF